MSAARDEIRIRTLQIEIEELRRLRREILDEMVQNMTDEDGARLWTE